MTGCCYESKNMSMASTDENTQSAHCRGAGAFCATFNIMC